MNKENVNIKLIDFGLAYCWEEDMKIELRESDEYKKLVGTVIEIINID